IDNGFSWQKVMGDGNLYNNTTPNGSFPPPKWSGSTSGVDGIWKEYKTTLPELGNQEMVYLRFRFVSDFSVAMEGIALDLVRIWDAGGPAFTLNPTSFDYEEFFIGTASDSEEFMIANITEESLELSPSDITIVGRDAIDFNLTNLEETMSFGPGDMAPVFVSFAPQSIGAKEASLQVSFSRARNQDPGFSISAKNQAGDRSVLQSSLAGIGILPSYYSAWDFSLVNPGQIPSDWTATDSDWGVNNSSFAGGASPEMRFNWAPRYTGDLYLKTRQMDTSGLESLNISYKHSVDDYSGSYTLKLLSIVGTTEYLIHQWVNPTGDIPAQTVEFTLNSLDHGVGANNLQIAWVFSGDTYNIDYWYIDDVIVSTEAPPPAFAHSPIPANNAIDVSVGTQLGWSYTTQPAYSDPVGYTVKIGTNPTLTGSTDTFVTGGVGTYNIDSPLILDYETTYYWQVIPTTETRSGAKSVSKEIRSEASNCPIWSFTTASLNLVIESNTYLETFDTGVSGWTSGFVTGSNLWELGTPAQTYINAAHSGTKAWMTRLTENYTNNANTWLQSPNLDFSNAANPQISVWINHWSEAGYDGMILESTLDDGLTWQYVSGNEGFYSNSLPYAPISAPKWSGLSGNWVEYSAPLTGLGNQASVYLRFRFASDNTLALEGVALDDVSIWNSTQPVFSIYPSANNFGLIALGGAGSTQDFNISNQGAGVITLDPEDITLSGANASEFYLINISETVNIGSYESVQISVGFYPATTGLKSATLQINDNVTRAKQLQLSRDNFALRSSAQRDVHQVSLSAEVYQPDITSLPWEEDFTGIELGTLPAGWETTNVNWSTQDTSQSGGEAPELTFAYYYPGTNADFYVVSPFIDSSGMDELLLSFKQRTNHYEGDYVLKLMALVGSTEYLIQEWANPNQALAAQDLEFTLTALEHGVGAVNFRIAWVFSGNSVNIDQWLIDDILLAEKEIIPLTLNPPQNLIVSIVVGGVGLSWDAVNLATGYKVYSASMPNASSEDWVLEATVAGLSWSAALVDNLRFYKVIAIKE
ncbi:MAG: choice-of-anchor D domain-containing protein, partial [Candidatus Cloacimonetes bacterium]|nr:choice-of-anchor D domain-containing protein [Candidatus Cloacimonadota bacterium]